MDQLKGLTLHQPWASAIATGDKRFETRSWPTRYRGLVAIHAGKERRYMEEAGVTLPLGAIVAVATIGDVFRTDSLDASKISTIERRWGDWTAGRYAWRLDDVKEFAEPIHCRGFQGLWTVPPDVYRMIRQAVLL